MGIRSDAVRCGAHRRVARVMGVVLVLAGVVEAGDTLLVSATPEGASGDEESGGVFGRQSISGNGRFVAFESRASDLGPEDTNNDWDIYVWDRKKGTKVRASVAANGAPNGASGLNGILSANGRYVAFQSSDSDLVDVVETGFDSDIFVRDLKKGVTTRVSVDPAGAEADGQSHAPHISANGRWVVFQSAAGNLVAGDDNGILDVFLHDRKKGTTVRASVDSTGAQVGGDSFGATVSDNGRYVLFESASSELVPNDRNGTSDIFLRDTKLGTTVRLSVNAEGEEGDGSSHAAMISGNGRFAAFASHATNLVEDDGLATADIFVRDLKLGTIERVSLDAQGDDADGNSGTPWITRNGRFVAFETDATDLLADIDLDDETDVYLYDRKNTGLVRASVAAEGFDVSGKSEGAVASNNGRFIVFESDAEDLVPGDVNEARDVFLRDSK